MLRSRTAIRIRRARGRRRAFVLADVLIGGVMLGIGLITIISLTTRSLARQTEGEKRVVASWLADEILSMAVVEGPDRYRMLYDLDGHFAVPHDDFSYRIDIDTPPEGVPYRVGVEIRWSDRPADVLFIETLIAYRDVAPEEELREPLEMLDREARYDEQEFGETQP